jgi:hypothetical protein
VAQVSDRTELENARAERDIAKGELGRIKAALETKGGTEWSPTQWAYDQACAALHREKARADKAESELREARAIAERMRKERDDAEKHIAD